MEIPVFDVTLDEQSGIGRISFVSDPAIGVGWMTLAAEAFKMELVSEKEHKVFGPVLIPDQLILRRDGEGKPFFIRFTRDVIEKARDYMMKHSAGFKINGEHSKVILDGVFLSETFIKDSEKGANPPEKYKDMPDGTLFAGFKVDNSTVWDKFIETGEFTGFSIEAMTGLMDTGKTAPIESDRTLAAILTQIEQDQNFISMKNEQKSALKDALDKIKAFLAGDEPPEDKKPEQLRKEFALVDGTMAVATTNSEGAEATELAEGVTVMAITDEGETPLADGDHQAEDGTVFTTEGGVITSMTAPEAPPAEPSMAEMKAELDKIKSQLAEAAKLSEQLTEVKAAKDQAETKVTELETKLTEAGEMIKLAKETIEAVSKLSAAEPSQKKHSSTVPTDARQRAIEMGRALRPLNSN